jgi:hypothetical protein
MADADAPQRGLGQHADRGKVRWAILHIPLRDLIAGLHHHTQHFRQRPAPRPPRQPQRPFRGWRRPHDLKLGEKDTPCDSLQSARKTRR